MAKKMDDKKAYLDDILHFEKIIMKNYNELAELEIKGKLFSKEYHQIVIQIKMIRDVIIRKWRSIALTGKEIVAYSTKLLEENNLDGDLEPIFALLYMKEHKEVIRMLSDLYYYGIQNHQSLTEVSYSDIDGERTEYKTEEEMEELKEEYNIETNMQVIDELNLFLANVTDQLFFESLLKEIDKEEDEEKKKRLIELKYDYIANSQTLENRLTTSPQNLTCIAYYEEMVNVLIDKNKEDFEYYCIDSAVDLVEIHLEYLAGLKDWNEETQFDAHYHVLYMKALMCLVPKGEKKQNIIDYMQETLKIKGIQNSEVIALMNQALVPIKQLKMKGFTN